jgi:predicted permease
MRFWHLITARLRAIVLRQRSENEMDEELRLHLERTIEQRIAAGMPPDEARRLTRLEFGGVEQIKEDCRDARGIGLVDHISRDMRHGVRRLARDWQFTTAAILILALGIGANTAIFSVVNTAFFREQAFDPDRLVEIYQRFGDSGSPGGNTYPAYLDMAGYTDVFAATTAVLINGALYQGNEGLRTAVIEYTTPSYLSVLGLRPSRGRWFDPREDTRGAEIVAVVGYKTWQTRFASDPSIIGRTIRINAAPVTIIGIGPQGHNNTLNAGIVTDFWLPVSSMLALGEAPYSLDRRPPEPAFFVKARLREGKTVAEAQVAMDNLGRRLAADYPTEDPGKGIAVFSSRDVRVHPQIDALLASIATVLLIIVGLTLAIACSNLATLLLVRGASRSKEVSVRLALGATRGQIVRHLVMESLILSVAGGIAGCVLAYWTVASLSSLGLPILVDVRLDYRVLGFTLVLSLLTGLAFGLTPALKATRIALLPTLRDEGGSLSLERHWFTLKNALLVFQVVMSFVLLAGTGMFVQFLLSAQRQDPGFTVTGVALLATDMRYAGYVGDQALAAHERLRQRIEGLPGVERAILQRGSPTSLIGPFVIERDRASAGSSGNSAEPPAAGLWWLWAGPGYFDALRIRVLRGRVFDERDRLDTPRVAVISADTAVRYFGSLDAVGRRFRLENEPSSSSWFEIIGVVKQTTPNVVDGTRPLFYRSYLQAVGPPTTVLARTSLDATALVGAMQRELRAMDPRLPVIDALTLEQHMENALFFSKAMSVFLGALGVLGLTLAGIGLYAVVAFAVSQRSREVGIRMALGARSSQVTWLIAREVASVMSVAVALGAGMSVAAGLVLARLDASAPNFELRVAIAEPASLAVITVLMMLVATAATYFPVRRAAKADPVSALRHT